MGSDATLPSHGASNAFCQQGIRELTRAFDFEKCVTSCKLCKTHGAWRVQLHDATLNSEPLRHVQLVTLRTPAIPPAPRPRPSAPDPPPPSAAANPGIFNGGIAFRDLASSVAHDSQTFRWQGQCFMAVSRYCLHPCVQIAFGMHP